MQQKKVPRRPLVLQAGPLIARHSTMRAMNAAEAQSGRTCRAAWDRCPSAPQTGDRMRTLI
ncbi:MULTISPECIES: hypothetical protein [Paenibacillus]|uniref:hypothetical protein n=1 Tax=Paenibacillus TaxID=44249 RepID=UPI0022B87562|nr:hypothetical protein [Paenibacillus caseinilyticus]MCZ8523825.1 hypothetical protein [Paenibacillus caseinilyticus]